jgi:homoserine dehydrogenase
VNLLEKVKNAGDVSKPYLIRRNSFKENENENGALTVNMDAFLDHVVVGSTPHTIIIDATTSFDIASLHPLWLKRGAHVVTANKRALSNSLELYNSVYSAVR